MMVSKKILSSVIGLSVVLVACGGGGGNNSSNNGNSGGDTAAAADTSASAAAAASDAASTTAAASDTSASDAGAASAPDAASTPTPAAFACATGYSRLDIPSNASPSKLTTITNDNIATLALAVPTNGLPLTLTVCLGKLDPLPAGVVADYAYEITASNNEIWQVIDMLTFNFSTNAPVTGLPVIERAIVTSSGVTYAPTVAGPLVSAKPNYSVAARVNSSGLYVIRLSK